MSTKNHRAGKVSKRSWSPHQATLTRRNRFDGDQATLNSALKSGTSFVDDKDDEDDYLTKSLRSIDEALLTPKSTSSLSSSTTATPTPTGMNHPRSSVKNGKPLKYAGRLAGRRPFKPTMTLVVKDKNTNNPPLAALPTPTGTGRYTILSKAEETDRRSSRPSTSSSTSSTSTSTSTPSTARIDRDTTSTKSRSKSRDKSKTKKRSKSKTPNDEESTSTANSSSSTNTNTIPIEMQQKLYKITDPNTSIKEKVELELEFRNGTQEQKDLYLRCKQQFERLRFMQTRAAMEQQKRDEINANAAYEKNKEAEFQKSLEQKRQQKRRLENERKARELKNKNDARHYKARTVAKTMGEIKEAALEAATVSVERNQRAKEAKLQAERQRIIDFRNNEGKDMTDAQLVLAEALMAQDDMVLNVTALDGDDKEEDDEEEKARKKAKKKAKKAKKKAKKLKRAAKLKKESEDTASEASNKTF